MRRQDTMMNDQEAEDALAESMEMIDQFVLPEKDTK